MTVDDMIDTHPAIVTVAYGCLHAAVEAWTEEGWGNVLPDIGEFDYDRVVAVMMAALPDDPGIADVEEAYAVLSDRAEDVRR